MLHKALRVCVTFTHARAVRHGHVLLSSRAGVRRSGGDRSADSRVSARGVALRRVLSFALVLCVGAAETACSGSAPSPPSASDVNLVIGGLATAFPGSSCTREFPGTRGATGTTLFLTFTYSAPQGNLTGGRVQLLQTYNAGDADTHTFAI